MKYVKLLFFHLDLEKVKTTAPVEVVNHQN